MATWEKTKVWETANWIAQKKQEIKKRIGNLAYKLTLVTGEAQKFGPKKYRKGLKIISASRPKMFKHWHLMALRSLAATRRQIYRLEKELKDL